MHKYIVQTGTAIEKTILSDGAIQKSYFPIISDVKVMAKDFREAQIVLAYTFSIHDKKPISYIDIGKIEAINCN